MKEKLLRLIDEAELLHATANADGNTVVGYQIQEAINALQWAYRELVRYE